MAIGFSNEKKKPEFDAHLTPPTQSRDFTCCQSATHPALLIEGNWNPKYELQYRRLLLVRWLGISTTYVPRYIYKYKYKYIYVCMYVCIVVS